MPWSLLRRGDDSYFQKAERRRPSPRFCRPTSEVRRRRESAAQLDRWHSSNQEGRLICERDRQYPTNAGKYANKDTTAANTSNANPI
jgi:hypothetical protein